MARHRAQGWTYRGVHAPRAVLWGVVWFAGLAVTAAGFGLGLAWWLLAW
jgi:hypothetical protein